MTTDLFTAARCAAPETTADAVIHPLLHVEEGRVYHPLTDRQLVPGDEDYEVVRALAEGRAEAAALETDCAEALRRAGWLMDAAHDPSREHLLKVVSLEAHTVCNQSCFFCPVSVAPRDAHFMPTELYEEIVRQLGAYRDTIDAVFMISYNEPTVDKRFLDQVRAIRAAGLPPAVLTNGSGLTPQRIDALVEMGGLRYLSINLSTVDRERYRATRGGDHLATVLRHLDHAKDLPVSEQMEIVVLGTGDEAHREDFAALEERFAGSRFTVKSYEVMDRAGYLQIGNSVPPHDGRSLCGCDNVGSRPLQHLHITPHGRCVLCCEDYDEKYVVGDLTRQTVAEVLEGPALALMRRWIYGIEKAPDDFICNRCVFALKR
jgi:wyosine [tRNA(Phe)-imidazoG37] synthetase (radical SAM superfamily)